MWRSEKAEAAPEPEPEYDYLKVWFRDTRASTVFNMDAKDLKRTFYIEDNFLVICKPNGNTVHFPVSDILQYEYSTKPF